MSNRTGGWAGAVGAVAAALGALVLGAACGSGPQFDLILRGGTIYDGSGGSPYTGDVAIRGDAIAAIGLLEDARAREEIDVSGLAVAPGFINVLSWATESLIEDGRSQSDIRQGVTLEVFGEGWSMGPLNDSMKKEAVERQGDIKFEIAWTTLAEYLEHLVRSGVSTNVASFVGATTARIHVLGHEDRAPTPEELERMRGVVRQAMEEGALGVGSSLIYAPAFYARTDELIALAAVAAEHGGMYISHIRSEGNRLLEAIDEIIEIARQSGARAEIYHLKAAGKANWGRLEDAIAKIDAARAQGVPITASMYTYTAGSTGLDAAMPPWVQEGGHRAWVERLKDPAIRRRVVQEMKSSTDAWENFRTAAGPENILLVGFKSEALKPLTGKTVAEVAALRGKSPEETILDLVIEDDSRVEAVYFLMSEENVRRQLALPWVSFGSDAPSLAPEGVFLRSGVHPRAYGNFARLLGKYVREEKIVPLEEAIRRLTLLPASNLRIERRGMLAAGNYADVVVFDPERIQDHATYAEPHRYSTGVRHVWVNGVQVLRDGEHTGARPGRVVHGPGRKKAEACGGGTAKFRPPAVPYEPDSGTLAVKCGRLIDGVSEEPLAGVTVLIEKGRIQAVGTDVALPKGVPVLDLSGYTVLPGLIDMHTHLIGEIEDSNIPDALLERPAEEEVNLGRKHAAATLMAGFTSVRDLGVYHAWTDRMLRDRIDRGEAVGPRMQVAGYYLTVPGGGGDVLRPDLEEGRIPPQFRVGVGRGAEHFRRKAQEAVEGGADVIKVIASGAILAYGGVPGAEEMTPEEIRAAAEVAHAAGKKLSAHAHGAQSIKEAILAGADTIEHASLIDEEGLRLARERGVALAMDMSGEDYVERVAKPAGFAQEFIDKLNEVLPKQRAAFTRAYERGVPLVFATDAGTYPHGENATEFSVMVRQGMKPMEAIKAATSVAARTMGWEDRVGAIAPGRFGDLIAVKGDPLADVRVLEEVKVVVKGGLVFKPPS